MQLNDKLFWFHIYDVGSIHMRDLETVHENTRYGNALYAKESYLLILYLPQTFCNIFISKFLSSLENPN